MSGINRRTPCDIFKCLVNWAPSKKVGFISPPSSSPSLWSCKYVQMVRYALLRTSSFAYVSNLGWKTGAMVVGRRWAYGGRDVGDRWRGRGGGVEINQQKGNKYAERFHVRRQLSLASRFTHTTRTWTGQMINPVLQIDTSKVTPRKHKYITQIFHNALDTDNIPLLLFSLIKKTKNKKKSEGVFRV